MMARHSQVTEGDKALWYRSVLNQKLAKPSCLS